MSAKYESKKEYKIGFKRGFLAGELKVLRDICEIVNDNEYPEYLEEDICDYLKDHGMKGDKNDN